MAMRRGLAPGRPVLFADCTDERVPPRRTPTAIFLYTPAPSHSIGTAWPAKRRCRRGVSFCVTQHNKTSIRERERERKKNIYTIYRAIVSPRNDVLIVFLHVVVSVVLLLLVLPVAGDDANALQTLFFSFQFFTI